MEVGHCNEQEEIEKCNEEQNNEFRFNTKMGTQPARGHIIHSWDILLDMGTQGLEITLPRLLEGTCKSQTVSSLSFGSRGGRSVELNIITNLGENYYVACGKGAIIARRCMKQRYVELGITKTTSSGRAICINNLVTVGPSKPVLTARVIEHARKRKRQRKTSRQRRISKANRQMTAMGIIVGGLRADSGEIEEGAEDEEKDEAEITEKQKLGKLITLSRTVQYVRCKERRWS